MPNLNKVMLMGNLTRDPELRYLPSNMPVVNLGLAVNRRWRNQQSGEQQEETTFIDCEAFARTAEIINQYMKKGRPLFVEGRLRLDQWQDKEGNNRSKMKVIIENFQFIDSRDGSGDQGGSYSGGQQGGGSRPAPRQMDGGPPSHDESQYQQPSGGHQAVGEDDIPF